MPQADAGKDSSQAVDPPPREQHLPDETAVDNNIQPSHRDDDDDDDDDDQLQVARRFLAQDAVKSASREKKIQFLTSKGIGSNDIEKLLGQSEQQHPDSAPHSPDHQSGNTQTTAAAGNPSLLVTTSDRPPIVTYPEFLVKPQRQPPLVTKDGLFSTLYAFAGLSTLLYGTSKYLAGPMVDSLTDARTEMHRVTANKLQSLIAQLEKTVSVLPSTTSPAGLGDDTYASDAEDPAELFHRDVGTQTSLIDTSSTTTSKKDEPAPKRHADNLACLSKSISVLRDQYRAQSEGLQNIKTVLDVFQDDLDGMTYYGGAADSVGGYDIYGALKRNEPEDEIRKVRDNIRRIKGVLLSTRNFPAFTR
ncbi:uncharacterized protein UV8b_05073 [Ustilaginoidea virens]|uniref:Peroxisomal membrane protein PEX14 n=1 Tax=Ustilaginoidea virens TaxID=1159556 RepID=A0A063BWY7_USTVR|nr:uncharacterized protein UV8b_05073 [Ustilaginoidea virens]QUC20832.1 hypothetical protein UV8b_05073 [Ustilaginoidea virens]GAO14905.1 hypothetical protein UVI_02007440 [Ustilaginoidea virens]